MRLLNIYTLQFQEFFENEVPPYHILSHRWSREEISFEEFTRNKIPDKRGYRKVVDFCRFIRQRRQDGLISRRAVDRHGAHRMVGDDMSDLAAHDFEPETGERPMLAGAEWVWIDTCCIDKRSSAELTEAINSMFKWYARSYECVVRLTDVPSWQHFGKTCPYRRTDTNDRLDELGNSPHRGDYREYTNEAQIREQRERWLKPLLGGLLPYFERSLWFTRGWTLQELLAPEMVVFCNSSWEVIGHVCKSERCTRNLHAYGLHLTEVVSSITAIPELYLNGEKGMYRASIAQRMSWASHRTTTRLEDEAYCLLGLFNVNIPMVYGEGRKAFRRLQLEIMRKSTDQSLFAWWVGGDEGDLVSVFASSPAAFAKSSDVQKTRQNSTSPYTISNNGLEIDRELFQPVSGFNRSKRVVNLKLACGLRSGERFQLQLNEGQDRYFRALCADPWFRAHEQKSIGSRLVYIDTGDEEVVDLDDLSDSD